MDVRHATLALVALVVAAGCLGLGTGGQDGGGSDAGAAVDSADGQAGSDRSNSSNHSETLDSHAGTDSRKTTGGGEATAGTAERAPENLTNYYLYVNEDAVDRRVSLFVVDGDVESLAFDLANGSTATATRPTEDVLRTGVTDVRPAGDVLWNETVTVESNSTVLLAFRNVTRPATVVKHSVTNATDPGEPLSSVDVASASLSQTVAVDGPGAQRSVSGHPLDMTAYADVRIDAVRTIDLNESVTG